MPSIDEATALARRALQMFNDRDVDCFVSCFTADAEWWPLRSATEGAYTGPEGIRAWFRETDELFDYIQAELGEVESIGGAAVSDGQLHVRGKGSGATVDMPITWVFRFEGEQVAWARAYADRAEALSDLAPASG